MILCGSCGLPYLAGRDSDFCPHLPLSLHGGGVQPVGVTTLRSPVEKTKDLIARAGGNVADFVVWLAGDNVICVAARPEAVSAEFVLPDIVDGFRIVESRLPE